MRQDKLTSQFQQALAEAQSLAVTRDNPYIEPIHVLAAMLAQDDGPRALLERAGVRLPALQTAVDTALNGLPQVQGGEPVGAGRDLVSLLQGAEKEASKRGDQFIASEMFLLALSEAKIDLAGVVLGAARPPPALAAARLDEHVVAGLGGRGDDDLVDRRACAGALDAVLEGRLAREHFEHLPRQPTAAHSRLDDRDGGHASLSPTRAVRAIVGPCHRPSRPTSSSVAATRSSVR